MSDKGLAVCLASAFFGHYAHSGFLNGLERAGVRPARLSGASGGALAAGLWAGGLRGDALEEEILKLGFRRSFFDLGAIWRWPGVASWSYASGVLNGTRMRRRLRRLVGERRIEELGDPALEIAVANLSTGRGEIRTSGPLIDFLIASMAMPLVFRVQEIEGERFLDGGMSNETPYSHWLDDPSVETIVIHRIRHHDMSWASGFMTPARVVAACHGIPNRELEEWRRREAERSGKEIVFLDTEYGHPGVFRRRATLRQLIDAGAATARRWLDGRA